MFFAAKGKIAYCRLILFRPVYSGIVLINGSLFLPETLFLT